MTGLEKDTEFLKALADWARATPAALAKKAGVAVSTINRPFSATATSRLSRTTLDKLQTAYPDFPGWADLEPETPIGTQDPDLIEIKEIDLKYGMGASYLDLPVASESRVFSRTWLRNFTTAPPERLFWATGDGDSMEPTIRAGEIFLIDTSHRTPRMSDGIWALALGEIGMVKRLSFQGGGFIELHSDNPLVRPVPVSEDELHIIGRVIAVVRRL